MMKRVVKLALSLVLGVALLVSQAACGSSDNNSAATTVSSGSVSDATTAADNSTTEATNEPVTITAGGNFSVLGLAPGEPNNPVMDEITKATGVKLKIIDMAGDKFKVLAASGDLPDLVSKDGSYQKQFIEGGLAMPLDDLVASRGQNITQNAASMIKYNKEFNSNNTGKLYYITTLIDDYSSINAVFNPWIRWDYYKELGYPQVNNYDDLYNVVTEMVKRHPKTEDGKPFYAVSTFSDWGAGSVLTLPGGQLDRAVGGAGLYEYDLKANAYTCSITTPDSSWYRASKFFNKIKRAGMLDPDTYTQTGEIYGNKEKAGRYAVVFENWNALQFNADARKNGKDDQGYMPLPVPKGAAAYWAQAWPAGNNQCLISISPKCKTPEKAMDLLNFMFTPEGSRLVYNGIKDVDYKSEGGILQWTKEAKEKQKSMGSEFQTKTGVTAFIQFAGFGRYMTAPDGQYMDLNSDPKALAVDKANMAPWKLIDDFCAHYGVNRVGDTADFRQFGEMTTDQTLTFRTVSQTAPAPKEINTLRDKLETYWKKEFPKLIMSAKSDAEFEAGYKKIQDGMMKLGLDTFTQYYDKAFGDAVAKSNEILGIK